MSGTLPVYVRLQSAQARFTRKPGSTVTKTASIKSRRAFIRRLRNETLPLQWEPSTVLPPSNFREQPESITHIEIHWWGKCLNSVLLRAGFSRIALLELIVFRTFNNSCRIILSRRAISHAIRLPDDWIVRELTPLAFGANPQTLRIHHRRVVAAAGADLQVFAVLNLDLDVVVQTVCLEGYWAV